MTYGLPLCSSSVVAVNQILNDFGKAYGATYCGSLRRYLSIKGNFDRQKFFAEW